MSSRHALKRIASPALGAALSVLALIPVGAQANHARGTLASPVGNPVAAAALQNGDWSFIANFPAGPAATHPIGVDVEPFQRQLADGLHRYLIASSMTVGFSIFDVTAPGQPLRVSDYGASACGPEAQVQQLIDILASAGDFDAGSTALGTVHGWESDIQVTPDGRIAVIATDAAGRCHDPVAGGLEIIDISDPVNPSLLGLVRLAGESHNATIDRDRPWLIYNSNSDSGGNNFIDVVDMSSCLTLDPSGCRPSVGRFQFEDAWTTGTHTPDPSACHDLDYVGHKLYGGCINSSLVLDVSGVLRNGQLTGTDLTDPAQVGEQNACTLENPSLEALVPVEVVDCRNWTVEAWKEAGAHPVQMTVPVKIRHAGANLDEDAPPAEDVQIAHQATPLAGGKIMIVSDERGGGLNAPPGECPGGGLWFFDIRHRDSPAVARTPGGAKAVFLPTPDDTVQTEGSNCTAHVFHPWAAETGMITEAWYSSGTQVFRYRIDLSTSPATVSFSHRLSYVPAGASTWTSRPYFETTNPDGSRALYFIATDISRGFDFFKLTLGS